MLRAGIVGSPNVGKSTLFNGLVANALAEAANFPFCTIEPNVGVVSVPDERLQVLADISKSEQIVPTRIEFVDIAGLVKGASQGEGLGNKFLSHIREVDAIVHVVRCFDNDDIIHVAGSVDPNSLKTVIDMFAPVDTTNNTPVTTSVTEEQPHLTAPEVALPESNDAMTDITAETPTASPPLKRQAKKNSSPTSSKQSKKSAPTQKQTNAPDT